MALFGVTPCSARYHYCRLQLGCAQKKLVACPWISAFMRPISFFSFVPDVVMGPW